jgi:tetratricopeptide (TPR) repeat protein
LPGKARAKGGKMRKWFGLWAAAAAGAGLIAGAATAAPKADEGGLSRTLLEIGAAADRHDCKTVVRLGAPVLDRHAAALTGDLAPLIYDLVVGCEWDTGATERAYAHALRGTALVQSSDLLWRARFGLELSAKNYPAAVATVEAMAQGRGAALNGVDLSWIWQLDRGIKDSGATALRRRLLKVLAGDSYLPDDLYGPADDFKLAYANLLVDAGEAPAARALVASLQTASAIASASLDQFNWYWNGVAATETTLGHYDQAVAAYAKAAAFGERGGLNVSQVINLAETQNGFGRGADALKTLAVFADPKRRGSPFGEMQLRFARACANHLAGHEGDTAADLAYLKAHEKDGGPALSDALLCLGDMDAAAAAFIRRLDDPDRRAAVLLQLSDYDDPPVPLPADPVESRLAALKARPDVKAAIDRAGGTRRFHIQGGEL